MANDLLLACLTAGCTEPPLIHGACYDHALACPSCHQPVVLRDAHVRIDCIDPAVTHANGSSEAGESRG